MAEVIERDIAAGPGGEIVERKVVPQRKGISPLGALILVAFVATCVVVFFGDRLGLGTPAIGTPEATSPPPPPAPQPTTP